MFHFNLIDRNRNFGLDIIRACSIMMVVYSHTGVFFHEECGVIGVEFFFCLSGFLIGGILFRAFSSTENLVPRDLLNFWKKRWWRTLPLYYLVLFIKYIATGFAIGPNIIYYIFFLQNHFYGISFMGVSWSLAVEEWFYILIPVMLFVLHRHHVSVRRIMAFLLVFCVMVVGLKFYFAYIRHTPFTGIRPSIPLRLDSLCIGVVLAYFRASAPLKYEKLTRPLFPLVSFIILAGLVYTISGLTEHTSLVESNATIKALWFPLFSIAVAGLIPFFEKSRMINQALKSLAVVYVPLTIISILTYSIYLTHMFSLVLAEQYLGHIGVYTGVKYVLILSLAYMVYVFYEHPMTQMRDRKTK